LAAAGIWGTVMMLFEEYPDVLHPSLRMSMTEIYRFTSFDSDSQLRVTRGGDCYEETVHRSGRRRSGKQLHPLAT
jgi:hypothetical protein